MRRRRRNPIPTRDWIFYGAMAFGVYWLYKNALPKLTGPGSAFDAATTGIASLFPGTSPTVHPQGTVILPDGSTAPISSFSTGGFNDDGSLNATLASGAQYTLLSGGNGTYIANDAGS